MENRSQLLRPPTKPVKTCETITEDQWTDMAAMDSATEHKDLIIY